MKRPSQISKAIAALDAEKIALVADHTAKIRGIDAAIQILRNQEAGKVPRAKRTRPARGTTTTDQA